MTFSPEDIRLLETLVKEERGEQAVEFVSYYVDSLRQDGDVEGAAVWTKVLALLFHDQAAKNHDSAAENSACRKF